MTIKRGDKVRIIRNLKECQHLKPGECYYKCEGISCPAVNREMLEFAGKTLTIKEIIEKYNSEMLFTVEENRRTWNTAMIEKNKDIIENMKIIMTKEKTEIVKCN
jgi:hypothetical protein